MRTESYPLLRVDPSLAVVYCLVYGLVFVVGFVGNLFVVAAVARHKSMRNITNYLITNLAVADMLIVLFCVPATLFNNVLTEWHFGPLLCKLSIWLNSVATGSSVFTLVAVTGDRFAAILYSLRYSTWPKQHTVPVIVTVWVIAGCVYVPWYTYAETSHIYHYINVTSKYDNTTDEIAMTACLCLLNFPSPTFERLWFLLVFFVAFVIPLLLITVLYVAIFRHIFTRTKTIACDHAASEREHRMRVRITVMMLIVIVLFACSWLPLYMLYFYIYFWQPQQGNPLVAYLRPTFQWLSLSNSCVNPILYAFFSTKYRDAFRRLWLLPFQRHYDAVRVEMAHTRFGSRFGSRSTRHGRRPKRSMSVPDVIRVAGLEHAGNFNSDLARDSPPPNGIPGKGRNNRKQAVVLRRRSDDVIEQQRRAVMTIPFAAELDVTPEETNVSKEIVICPGTIVSGADDYGNGTFECTRVLLNKHTHL